MTVHYGEEEVVLWGMWVRRVSLNDLVCIRVFNRAV